MMQEDFLFTSEEEQQPKSPDDNLENSVTSQQTRSQSEIIGTQNKLDKNDADTKERVPETPIIEQESSHDTFGFENVTLGPPLPAECRNKIILATSNDLEIWHQVPVRQNPFSVPPTQSQTFAQTSSEQENSRSGQHIFLPTPPPEPKHFYHQASLQQPPVTSFPAAKSHHHHHQSINPQRPPTLLSKPIDSTHSLTYLSHIPTLPLGHGNGNGNGWFLHDLPLYTALEVAFASPHRHFIPYLTHGHLEITPFLINRICPADLCHKPCPFDNIYTYDEVANAWLFGCKMLRLCEVMHKYPWKPPPALPLPLYVKNGVVVDGKAGRRKMNAGMLRRRIYRYSDNKGPLAPMVVRGGLRRGEVGHERECGFLHGVEMNCRWLARGRRDGVVKCTFAMGAEEGCVFGHDFEEERLLAYERLEGHLGEARVERGRVGRVWRNQKGAWMGLDRGSMVREGMEGEEFLRGLDSH